MSTLSLIDIEELIKEIQERNDACIIAYVKTLDSKEEDSQFHYTGGKFASLGLAHSMVAKLLDDINGSNDE